MEGLLQHPRDSEVRLKPKVEGKMEKRGFQERTRRPGQEWTRRWDEEGKEEKKVPMRMPRFET